jgi:hypothetical protein
MGPSGERILAMGCNRNYHLGQCRGKGESFT